MDSSEYKTMSHFYPKMIVCFKQSPNDIADQMRPLGILAPGDLEFLNNPHHNNDQKARKIVDVVMNHIQDDSQVFHKFVSALANYLHLCRPNLSVADGEWGFTITTITFLAMLTFHSYYHAHLCGKES